MKKNPRGFTAADIPESIKRLNSQIFNALPVLARNEPLGRANNQTATNKPLKSQQMNKLESEFKRRLESEHPQSVIRFQPFRLYLRNGHSYRPDFAVFGMSGEVLIYEVKGPYIHSRDSRILFDQASQEFPWKFFWARKLDGKWSIENVS